MKKLTRKAFTKKIINTLLLLPFFPQCMLNVFADERLLLPRKKRIIRTKNDIVSVRGPNIKTNLTAALKELGGIENFVKRGDTVVIKPNIGWNRKPEYAANTNPDLIEELVRICLKAGAGKVKIFDNTCNSARMCYANSGIKAAVKKAGGDIYHVSKWKFQKALFPDGSLMKGWPIFRDAVNCDCFINVPIAKHHSLTKLTLSMKNLMGICGGNRGEIHWNIDIKLAELTSFIKPDLTIIDCHRVLTRNGPSGGSLGDVKVMNTLIAGSDPVLADATAARLMGINPALIGHIAQAHKAGIGKMKAARGKSRSLSL